MTEPLIGYTLVEDESDVAVVMETYTHTCGYTRAWQDDKNRSLIYHYTDCPVEDVITQLQTLITIYVTAAATTAAYFVSPAVDKYLVVKRIQAQVNDAVLAALAEGLTTESISLFLQGSNKIYNLINDELIAQGVIA